MKTCIEKIRMDWTYAKTYYALKYVNENLDYDYIFRTNTSTYVNTKLLQAFVDSLEEQVPGPSREGSR